MSGPAYRRKNGTFGAGNRASTGRPKVADEFRARCRRAVDQYCITAWVDEVTPKMDEKGNQTRGKEWVRCSEMLAAYAYGRPAPVAVAPGDDDGEGIIITVQKITLKE